MKKLRVVSRKTVFDTAWFKLIAKTVEGAQDKRPHYVLTSQDYVAVFALTADRKVLLVRQYRPAIEKYTVELPSGHVEKTQTPIQAARAELLEETGYIAARMELITSFGTDAGRMTNRTWCYYAEGLRRSSGWKADPQVKPLLWPLKKLLTEIRAGRFDHAINLAAIFFVLWKKGILHESRQ